MEERLWERRRESRVRRLRELPGLGVLVDDGPNGARVACSGDVRVGELLMVEGRPGRVVWTRGPVAGVKLVGHVEGQTARRARRYTAALPVRASNGLYGRTRDLGMDGASLDMPLPEGQIVGLELLGIKLRSRVVASTGRGCRVRFLDYVGALRDLLLPISSVCS